ncbi:GRB10-interacting GYF protein 2-like, partial [Anopheles moucheti]|uniref:GRB10-interacting GYF protein 2-like n=1 Tax=Anopheles moucheti TaxID=186751 RepID=UPI0022F091CC
MEGVAVSGATSSSKYAAKLVTGCGGSPSSEVRRMISEAKLDNETLLTVVKKLEEQVSLLRVQLETAAEQARQDLREARLEARQREERLIADNLQLREELRKERELLTTLVAQSIGHNQPLQQQQGVASTSGAQRGGQAQQRQRKIKLDAIEIAPAEGQSWDEVYQLVRAAPELQRFNSQLGVGRRTMRSRLVMDVEKGADTAAILKCVQEVCARGDQPAAARLVTPMVEVRVDAIDPLAKEQDVALALASLAQSQVEESAVQLRKAWNGTKVAFVRVPEKAAEQLKDRHVLINSSKYAAKLVTGCGGSPSSEVRRMISEAKLDNETLLTVVKKLEEQVSLLRVQLETAAEQARQDLREARLEARQREERLIADNLQLREELRKERELLTTLVAQSIGHNQPLQQQQGVASTSGAQRGGQAQQRQRKIKLDAIEIAPAEGQSWDEVYQLVRAAPELQRFNSQLGVGRRTMRSRLVMDVEKGADTAAILKCVQEVCARGDQPAAARLVTPMVEVRVDAIDPLAKEQDVALALASLAQSQVEESAVQLRKAWNGTKVAFVRVPEKAAEQLKDRHSVNPDMVELRKVLGEMSLANEQLRAMVKELQQELVMLRQRTVANEDMAREERKLAREEFKLAQEKFHQELQWNKDQARQWYEETQRLRGELAKETACHQELLAQMLGCGGNQVTSQSSLQQPQQQQQQQQQQRMTYANVAAETSGTQASQGGSWTVVGPRKAPQKSQQQQQQQQLAKPRPQSAAAKHS